MSLIKREKRPLTRDVVEPRSTQRFIVGTDDTYAPDQYFGFLQISFVEVLVVPMDKDNKSSAKHALDRLLDFASKREEDDELWLLLDTDHYTKGTHRKTFGEAIHNALDQGVKIAVSMPCFDLWLLLHQVDESAVGGLTNAKQVGAAFRAKVGEFNKTNLKKEHYPIAAIAEAYRRAKRLDANVGGGYIPKTNTTRVWKLLEAIVGRSHISQLPAPLRQLLE